LPGSLSPWLYESTVRLGSWMPFKPAAAMLQSFFKVAISEDAAADRAETAGAAQVALQTEAVERIEQDAPPAPAGPAKLYLGADGAFISLTHKRWVEVKTLVIGEVAPPQLEKGEWVVHTHKLSYFSRFATAENFTRLALVETQRRGVETAAQVGAVMDGAEWLQGFTDYHRQDARRILDFPHAAGYVSPIGLAQFGADTPELTQWLQTTLHALKHSGPARVLAELRDMVAEHPNAEALELPKALAYLDKREAQMQYPQFQAEGWPIGSGPSESANKSVVEARLEGAGMHWADTHVDPLLALRNVVCNDRWEEAWPQIAARLRQQARERRATQRQERHDKRAQAEPERAPVVACAPQALQPVPDAVSHDAASAGVPSEVEEPAPKVPYRPAANHPWRCGPACLPKRSRFSAN
jgi:hypothetical protein